MSGTITFFEVRVALRIDIDDKGSSGAFPFIKKEPVHLSLIYSEH
jgi:hypothetical protein